jgi:hypothetical protein
MRLRYCLSIAACLLIAALVSAQTAQPPADSQSTASQTTTPAPPAKPVKQSAVAAAASASKQARDSAPAIKVVRNHDLNGGSNRPDAAKSEPKSNDAEQSAAQAKEIQEEEQKERQFENQGKVFQNQIKVEKGKIIGIQNHMVSLKNQFDAWSTSFSQDSDAPACWTSTYYTPYYKSWCDAGRNLKAQYDAAQAQLTQERAHLEEMQESIRRKGYGNAIYDPD